MASASFDCTVHVWNIINGNKIWDCPTSENVLSLEWNPNGSLLSYTTKDKLVNIVDPRSNDEKTKLSVLAHEGIKTSKVVWTGNDSVATTGFSKRNEREIRTWDIRNFTAPYDYLNKLIL